MKKLQLSTKKTLKLTNVLKWTVNVTDANLKIEMELEKMESFIKANGGKPVGPLIRYLKAYIDENEEMELEVTFMMQSNVYIKKENESYLMEPITCIPNCMYCRYIGPEDKINFAYDKIQLEAFENDIPLKGDSYTIFVDRNEEDETIIADVFMERADS